MTMDMERGSYAGTFTDSEASIAKVDTRYGMSTHSFQTMDEQGRAVEDAGVAAHADTKKGT